MESSETTYHDTISDGYKTFLIIASIFTAFSIICVFLRLLQRYRKQQIWWDDWLIIASLACACGLMITTALLATIGGAGYHVWTYEIPQLERNIEISLANNILYKLSTMFSKLSVVFLYHRIFSVDSKTFRYFQILGFVIVAYCITAVAGLIFTNSPVEGQWNLSVPSTTIDRLAFWVSLGVFNLIIDLILLGIPQTRVWKLQLSFRKKIAVSLVFLLGSFVCIVSAIRVVYFARIDLSDLTYAFTIPGIWTCIEMNTQIICASLPIIYQLFKHKQSPNSSKYSEMVEHEGSGRQAA